MSDCQEPINIPWAWIRKLNHIVQNAESGCEKPLPAEISPWLYISDEISSLDKEKLRKLGITHVLSTNGVPSYRDRFIAEFYQTQGIVHLRIKAEDEEGYGLIGKHWTECLDFIKFAREKDRCKLVVNCVAGRNRSALVSVSAYMIMENKNVLDAAKHCIDKRGWILQNKSFQKELCILAREHGLLGAKPEGFSDEPIQNISSPPPPIIRAMDKLLQ
mmetsp:Transcript_46477/g.68703  ORF Transcript_46477/g.68703 Transcript_46477/m.68703 type:complete len:217 (-) Transcript_46477:644-1294(-)